MAHQRKDIADKKLLYLLGIGIFTLLVCLVGFSYIGVFTRYATDDFCNLNYLEKYGWLDYQSNRYLNWSGRFSATFFTAILNSTGDWMVMILPGLTLLIWIICFTWSIYQYIKLLDIKHSFWVSLFTALLTVFAIVRTTPSLSSTLYWHIGLITYLFPLIFLTLYAGLIGYAINNDRHNKLVVILGFTLTFIAGGHSETSLIGQIVSLFFILIFIYVLRVSFPNDKTVKKILWAGFFGSCISFVIVRLAPGNAAREGFFPEPQLFPAFLKSNFYVVYLFLRPLMGLFEKPALILAHNFAPSFVSGIERALSRSASPIIVFVVVLFFAFLGSRLRSENVVNFKKIIVSIAFVFVLFYLIIFSTIFPSQYIMSIFPPLRAVFVSQSILVGFYAAFGFVLGWGVGNSKKFIGTKSKKSIYKILDWTIIALLLLNLITTTDQISRKVPEFQNYSQEYDSVMIKIKETKAIGKTELQVPLLDKPLFNDYIAFDEINPWISACTMQYFDLDITVEAVD